MSNQIRPTADVPQIDVLTAAVAQQHRTARFVDVREPDEWAEGHIPGAFHVPLAELPRRMNEIPRDTPVIMVCRSGARSHRATEYLAHHGFSQVRNLTGGMLDWQDANLPVERPANSLVGGKLQPPEANAERRRPD